MRDDEAETLIDAPVAPSSVRGATLTNSETLVLEQAARARAIVRVGVVVGTLSALMVQLPPNIDPFGRAVATVGLLAISVASAALLIGEKLGAPIRSRTVFGLSMVVWPSLLAVMWAIGEMSPVVMALMFGVYYFGLSDDKREGWICFAVNAGGHAVITVARLLGAWSWYVPMFAPSSEGVIAPLAMAFVVQLMLAMVFWLARLSRGATIDAMASLESARRQIQEREALLDEVAQDLQHAIGAGKRGRHSGKRFGAFVADDVIGRGAMGEVYRGKDHAGRHAAIKVLHPFFVASDVHVHRFFREAQITSELSSPHIVSVFESGAAGSGEPFLAMELLDGHDLAWHLRQRRRFSIKDTLALISQLSQALSVVQDERIVHRDLKPKNIFLDEQNDEPLWKILDFGVSKIRTGGGTLTSGNIIGTPGYMAPEQAKGTDVDHRADVFSLGAIAYRVLTGRPAFGGDSTVAVMYRVTHEQPVRPGAIVRLEPDLDLVLALSLAKDRERRIRSATTFAATLRDATRGELDERLRHDARALIDAQPWKAA